MNELTTLLALKLTSRKKSAENADVALKHKITLPNTRPSSSYAQFSITTMSGARHW